MATTGSQARSMKGNAIFDYLADGGLPSGPMDLSKMVSYKRASDFSEYVQPIGKNPKENDEEARQKAIKHNRKDVRLYGYQRTMQHVTGLLGFANTHELKDWVTFILSPTGTIKDWQTYQDEAMDRNAGISSRIIFKIIDSFQDDAIANLITGEKALITDEDIPDHAPNASYHYYRYLHAMNLLICNYPTHFKNDRLAPSQRYRMHSSENWYWALLTLKFITGEMRRDGRTLLSGATHKGVGIKPLFIDVRPIADSVRPEKKRGTESYPFDPNYYFDNLVDAHKSGYLHHPQDRYFDDEAHVGMVLAFAEVLNTNGNLTHDQQLSTNRSLVEESVLAVFFKRLRQDGLTASHSAAEIKKIEDDLEKEWQESKDSGKSSAFSELLSKISTASATEVPFLDACKMTSFNPDDLQIPESPLKPFPHQIMGKYID